MKQKYPLRNIPFAAAIATLIFSHSSHAQTNGTWLGVSGNWSDSSTWVDGSIAGGTGTANFTGVNIAEDQVITITAPQTIGNITFSDATTSSNNLLITGTAALILDAASGVSVINVTQSGRTLSVDSVINGTEGLQKIGAGALSLNGSSASSLTGGVFANGGNLILDYGNLATPTDLIDASNALQIGAGALTISGLNVASATTVQTFASTLLGAGRNTINIAKGAAATSATLNLGPLTANAGSTTIISPTTAWNTTASTTERVFLAAGGSVPTLPASGTAFVNAGVFHRVAGGANGSLRLAAVNTSGQLLLRSTTNLAATTTGTAVDAFQLNAGSIALANSANIYGLLLNATTNGATITLPNDGNLTLNSVIQIKASEGVSIAAGTGTSNVVIGGERNLVVAMDNAAALTINAPIVDNAGGASGLTVFGSAPSGTPGALTLGGANIYTGPTTITNAVVNVSNTNAFGGTSGIALSAGSILSSTRAGGNPSTAIAAPITLGAGGTSTIRVGQGAASNTHTFNINGGISGATSNLVFTTSTNSFGNGQSVIVLIAPSTYTGNTTLSTGNGANNPITIRCGVIDALPTTTTLTMTGGAGGGSGRNLTFDLNGRNQTLAGLTHTFPIPEDRFYRVASTNPATLTINNTSNFSFGGATRDTDTSASFGGTVSNAQITGAISLVKNGPGIFTLGGVLTNGTSEQGNAFTGSTTVLGGTLVLGESISLRNSVFDTGSSIAGDATNGLSTIVTALTLGGLTGSNSFPSRFNTSSGGYNGLTALTLNLGANVTHSYSGDIGDGVTGMNLIKTGAGTQIITVAQSYNGTTTVTAGVLIPTTPAALAGYNQANKVIFNGGTLLIRVDSGTWNSSQIDILLNNATKTSGNLGIDTSNGSLTQWATFSEANLGTIGLNKMGDNDLILNQANTFSGVTTVSQGTLIIGHPNALQNSVLNVTGGNVVLGEGVTSLSIGGFNGSSSLGSLSGLSNITLNVPLGASLVYIGSIVDGNEGMTVTKTGAGTQILTGSNSYTGATQINDGSLVFRSKISKANGVATTAAAGSIGLGVNNSDPAFFSATEVASLFNTNTLSGFNLDPASGVIIDTTSVSFDQTDILTGSRALTKIAGNTLTLSQENTYSGVTAVNFGILAVTNNNSLGSTAGATTVHGGNGTNAVTLSLSSAISDLTLAEPLNVMGNTLGRAQLVNDSAQNHALTGPLNVTSDTNASQVSSSGTGSITISGDMTGSITNGAVFFLRGTSTSASNQLIGNVNLVGNLAKADAGTWTIGSVGKTYSWANTSVIVGSLRMGLANVLPAATVVTFGNPTGSSTPNLDLNGFNQTVAGIVYNGQGVSTGTRTITSAAPAILTVNNAIDSVNVGTNVSTNNIVMSGALALTKQGLGRLSFNGVNTNSGDITVNEGILSLGKAASAADANVANDASTVTISADPSAVLDLAYNGTDEVNALFIGGEQKAPGVWGAIGSGAPNTDAKITGTGTLTVATGPSVGYSAWASTNVGGQAANLDFDSDGVTNGVEFFMNAAPGFTTNPTLNAKNSITWPNGGNLPAAAYGTQFVIQTSSDLLNWTDVPIASLTSNTDGPSGSLSFTLSGPAPRFGRLKVTPN